MENEIREMDEMVTQACDIIDSITSKIIWISGDADTPLFKAINAAGDLLRATDFLNTSAEYNEFPIKINRIIDDLKGAIW